MTAPDLSPAEAAKVAEFDAAPDLPESYRQSSPVALLAQLDELRAKATPGPWEASAAARHDVNVNAPLFAGSRISTRTATAAIPADAALIVAAVNALDGLVTVVREMWDEHDGRTCCDRTGPSFNGTGLCDTRQMIETALSVTP